MNQAIRFYFWEGRGGGGGRGRGWGGGGRGVVGTCWLFNSNGWNKVTRDMKAYIGPANARQLWQLWQLTWAMAAKIGHASAAELWQL